MSIDRFLEHCHRRRYPAKSVIIYAGDHPDVLYYIVSGSVTVLIEDEDGHEIVLAYLNPGDEVIIPQPSFVSYLPEVVFAGGKPVVSVRIGEVEQYRHLVRVADAIDDVADRKSVV